MDAIFTGTASTPEVLNRLTAFSSNPLVRSVSVVASGTFLAQVVNLAFTPVLTRLFDPAAFGAQSAFLATTAIIAVGAGLSYPLAIVLADDDHSARQLAWTSVVIGAMTSAVVFLAFALSYDFLVDATGLSAISGLLLFLPAGILLSVVIAVLEQWTIRQKLLVARAKIAVIAALAVGTARVIVGFVSPTGSNLVIASVLGFLVNALLLAWAANATRKSLMRNRPVAEDMRRLAARFKDFPYFRAPEQILNALAQGMPILLLAALFDTAQSGLYALAIAVIGVPVTLIGKSVSDVLYPRYSEASRQGHDLRVMILRATLWLFLLGLPIYALVAAFGPQSFSFLFGPEWRGAGEYASWLSPWYLMVLTNRAAVTALPVLGAQRTLLKYTVLLIILRVVAIYFGYAIFGSALASVILYSLVGFGLNAALIGITLAACARGMSIHTSPP